MIIQHWLFTSLGGFHGSFWLKREISSFWEENFGAKIWSGGSWLGGAIPLPSGRALSALGKRFSPKNCPHLHHHAYHILANFDVILNLSPLRKGGMGAGDTIQSYNHQKRDFQHRNISIDDDNIDVVNDNDKEPGETGWMSNCGFLKDLESENSVATGPCPFLMNPLKCKAVVLTRPRRSICSIIRIHLNVKQVLISGLKRGRGQNEDKHWETSILG